MIPTGTPSRIPPDAQEQPPIEASLGWAAIFGAVISALVYGIMGNWLYDVFFKESAEKFKALMPAKKQEFRNRLTRTIDETTRYVLTKKNEAKSYLINGLNGIKGHLQTSKKIMRSRFSERFRKLRNSLIAIKQKLVPKIGNSKSSDDKE